MGSHGPDCVTSCPRDIVVAKDVGRHLDDAASGEEPRLGTKRLAFRVVVDVGVAGVATITRVELWCWQAPRMET